MIVVLFTCYAVASASLLIWTFRRRDSSAGIWFLRFLLFGMFYDNLLQALGPLAIDSSWYLTFNYPRYILHAAVLPFLTLFSLFIMGRAGIRLADNGAFRFFCVGFTLLALAYGLWFEVALLELERVDSLGHLKLASVSTLPPLATIATNMLLLLLAAVVWRQANWPWFFLGGLFIFLLNGATAAQDWGFLAGNFAEIVFVIALLKTYYHFCQRGESLQGETAA